MTDDIVTRLREKYSGQLPICLEAADEIERLREELEASQSAVRGWIQMLGKIGKDNG